jgi:hypothetical protein
LWLKHLGRDDRFGLQRDDWVEVVDDAYTLQNRVGKLLKVVEIDPLDRVVTLSESPADVGGDLALHPYLRRWDHRGGNGAEGGLTLEEGAALLSPGNRLKLEDGIEISFQDDAIYYTGDYWLIPARVATGDIEWPRQDGDPLRPLPRPPFGIRHHYAPLAILPAGGGAVTDCRCAFAPLKNDCTPIILSYGEEGMGGPVPCAAPPEPIDG